MMIIVATCFIFTINKNLGLIFIPFISAPWILSIFHLKLKPVKK